MKYIFERARAWLDLLLTWRWEKLRRAYLREFIRRRALEKCIREGGDR